MAHTRFYHRLMAWMNRAVGVRVVRAFPGGAIRAFSNVITRAFSYGEARRGIYTAMAVIIMAGLGWGFSLGYRRVYVATQDARSRAREGQESRVKSPAIPPLEVHPSVAPSSVAPPPATASPGSHLPAASSPESPSPAASSPAAPSSVGSPQAPTSGASRVSPAEGDERPIAPVSGRVACSFGWARHPVYGDWRFHPGLDIEVAKGTPVRASMSGTVVQAGNAAEYGLSVTIEHHGDRSTFYGHLDSIAVAAGEMVRQGTVIGRSGDTGATKVPQVHYELRQGGEPVDPRQAIEFRDVDR